MPQIKCRENYSEGSERFIAGRSYHFTEQRAARLMRGAPDSWEVVEGEIEIGGPEHYVNYAERDREVIGAADARAAAKADQDREDAARHEEDRRAVQLAEERAPNEPNPPAELATPPDASPDEDEGDDDVDLLDDMTVLQLREHAAGLGINLGEARSKQAIKDAITSAGDDTEDD